MTPEHKQLVQESWARILPNQDTTAELFYNRLFDEHSELTPYFKGDMKKQGQKLMTMLDTAVAGLDNLETLIDPLKVSGKTHKEYGVVAEDYDKVGATFLWTLEQVLGAAFNADVEEAWAATYTSVANIMLEGAEYNT